MNKNDYKAALIAGGIFVVLAGIVGWTVLIFAFVRLGVFHQMTAQTASAFDVRFGILEVDSSKKPYLAKETTTIPLKLKDTGFEYGIKIVPPDDKPYTYQVVFHFSAAPKVITGDGFVSNEPSDTMKTTPAAVSGTTVDEYWFDDGDPTGDQSIDVYINGQLVKTIKYTVTPDDSGT